MHFFQRLSSRELRIFSSVYQAIIPKGGAFSEGALDVDPVPTIQKISAKMPVLMRVKIKLAIWLIEWFGLFYAPERKFFSRKSLAAQMTLLARLEESQNIYLREIFLIFKTIACFVFYEDNTVNERIQSPWRFMIDPV